MASFNKVVLMGRLTANPELKQTPNGASVTSFSIAVDRRFSSGENRQCDFFNIVAWGKTAEFISKYFRKGSALCIVGSIQTRSWQDNQGNKRYATEIVVDEAYFVDSKNEPQNSPTSAPYVPDAYLPTQTPESAAGEKYASPAPNFDDASGDDNLPF